MRVSGGFVSRGDHLLNLSCQQWLGLGRNRRVRLRQVFALRRSCGTVPAGQAIVPKVDR
jgi:hypothetical protein